VTSIAVSAPGKAVLSGEYAVLRGAPAISTAVDRRALVRLVTTDRDYHCVTTPGFAEGTWRFKVNDSAEIDWLDSPPCHGLKLIEEAWRCAGTGIQGGLSLTVDTAGFFATGANAKLGLGSSAAAMTALVCALEALTSANADVYALARTAHKALQQGLGSGVDIATSFYGGVIEFGTGAEDVPQRHPWPDGLEYRFLWSGASANTMNKIYALDGTDDSSWGPLLSAAAEAAEAWAAGDISQILHVFRQYADVLRQFSIDQHLGIFDAGHDELADLAASVDLVYKPCGAGGGDIGIVMAGKGDDDSLVLDQFCDKAETAGFHVLAMLPDPDGVSFMSGDGR